MALHGNHSFEMQTIDVLFAWQAKWLQFPSRYKCPDPIAACDREQEMGRVLRIMIDCHMGGSLPPDLSLAKMIDEGFWRFIICTLDP